MGKGRHHPPMLGVVNSRGEKVRIPMQHISSKGPPVNRDGRRREQSASAESTPVRGSTGCGRPKRSCGRNVSGITRPVVDSE